MIICVYIYNIIYIYVLCSLHDTCIALKLCNFTLPKALVGPAGGGIFFLTACCQTAFIALCFANLVRYHFGDQSCLTQVLYIVHSQGGFTSWLQVQLSPSLWQTLTFLNSRPWIPRPCYALSQLLARSRGAWISWLWLESFRAWRSLKNHEFVWK